MHHSVLNPNIGQGFQYFFSTHNHHPSSGTLFKVDFVGISSDFSLGFAFFCLFFKYRGEWDLSESP